VAHIHTPHEVALEPECLFDQPFDLSLLVLDSARQHLAPRLVDRERPVEVLVDVDTDPRTPHGVPLTSGTKDAHPQTLRRPLRLRNDRLLDAH